MTLKVKTLYLIAIAASVFYWCFSIVLPSELLNDLLDGALMANCAVVTWIYFLWGLQKYDCVADRAETVRVGIVLGWFGAGLWRLERFIIQVHAFGINQTIGVHDPMRGWMILLGVLATAYHIIALDQPRPGVPSPRYLALGLASMASGVLAVALFLALGLT